MGAQLRQALTCNSQRTGLRAPLAQLLIKCKESELSAITWGKYDRARRRPPGACGFAENVGERPARPPPSRPLRPRARPQPLDAQGRATRPVCPGRGLNAVDAGYGFAQAKLAPRSQRWPVRWRESGAAVGVGEERTGAGERLRLPKGVEAGGRGPTGEPHRPWPSAKPADAVTLPGVRLRKPVGTQKLPGWWG